MRKLAFDIHMCVISATNGNQPEKRQCRLPSPALTSCAGAPADLVQIVTGYGDAGNALVTGGVDKLIFVGSTKVPSQYRVGSVCVRGFFNQGRLRARHQCRRYHFRGLHTDAAVRFPLSFFNKGAGIRRAFILAAADLTALAAATSLDSGSFDCCLQPSVDIIVGCVQASEAAMAAVEHGLLDGATAETHLPTFNIDPVTCCLMFLRRWARRSWQRRRRR